MDAKAIKMNIQDKNGTFTHIEIPEVITKEELLKLLPKENWYEKITRFFKNIHNIYIILRVDMHLEE